ncbi:MAG TPA: ABC transporter permease [Elusimicrobiota bacterium]|nr:ABC transporter permease [Elusimicrobiota bacterium]
MDAFRWDRALSIARKEVRHIRRDPFTLAAGLGIPVLLVLFFGFVMDFDVRDIRLLVQDADRSRASRELLELFRASGHFDARSADPVADPAALLAREKAKAVLVIPPGFGRDRDRGVPARAQVLLDGADNSTAGVILSYVAGIQQAAARRGAGADAAEPVEVRTRFLFNPELNSRWFVVPGLAAVVIGLLAVLLTALTVAREWENGSMELLLSTPVRPLEILVGKLAPYVALGMGGVLLVYLTARFVFDVPFEGSHALFFSASFLFLGAALGQGLLISVTTRQQPLAMQLGIVTGLLPSLLLSGFVFPIESMPLFFRALTALLPVRWYMTVTRGIFLRGAGPADLWVPLTVLTAMSLALSALALKKFKTDLEP